MTYERRGQNDGTLSKMSEKWCTTTQGGGTAEDCSHTCIKTFGTQASMCE